MSKVCYRNLTSYKYQVMKDYSIQLNLTPLKTIRRKLAKFLSLSPHGVLSIRKFYAWDGHSGPTIDTRDFMRGSLIHDALYQLMREGVLDYRVYRQRLTKFLGSSALKMVWARFGRGIFIRRYTSLLKEVPVPNWNTSQRLYVCPETPWHG
jgi:hypothetical protein